MEHLQVSLINWYFLTRKDVSNEIFMHNNLSP